MSMANGNHESATCASLVQDSGAGIVEYVLLVVFIALALIVAVAVFTGALGDAFSNAANSIPT